MEDTATAVGVRVERTDPAQHEPTFEEFFEREHQGLYGALRLLCRDAHEAEELMQDSFLKLLERWDRLAEVADRSGYLYRTAMNLFRSRRRRAQMAIRRTFRPEQPVDALAAVDACDAVIRALAPLTRAERAAVVLVDVLGFTSEQAGEALGIKASTVRVLVSRGRTTLKETWGAQDG